MVDTKVSALTAATALNAADYILLTQAGSSLKLSVDNLALKMPTRIIVNETAESPASGALATNKLTSLVTPAGTPTAYTLAAGTHGMEKELACAVFTSGTAVITVTSGYGFSTLTFDEIGEAVKLKNISGVWYIVGNRNVIVDAVTPFTSVTEASEALTTGVISTTKLYTKLTANTSAYTLAAGLHGQQKKIVCGTFTAATGVVTVTGGSGFTTLTFSALGQGADLQNIDGSWYVTGISGAVRA